MEIKIDCYILRTKVRGVWYHWVFLCKLNPSDITEKEICKGVEAFLNGASFAIDEVDEIKIEKKSLKVIKQWEIRR